MFQTEGKKRQNQFLRKHNLNLILPNEINKMKFCLATKT